MSEIKVNSIKGVGASSAAITVNNTDGTCTANVTNNLSNRRINVNGAMTIAQRGTSNTSGGDGYYTVDRMYYYNQGIDNDVTKAQADVASGTTPYTLGFRKSFKLTNGDQSNGAGTSDQIQFRNKFEAQDIANSGWNYKSSSSYITLSFWVKSSVAQNFYFYMLANDGTVQNFPMETGSLTQDTWTKVTKTISGNSNLQFDNNNAEGMTIVWDMYRGTGTTGSISLDAWAAFNSSVRTPDNTSTWYTTNNATFEITGVQLEVGSNSTDFEFKSYNQELALCQRYFEKTYAQEIALGTANNFSGAYTARDGTASSVARYYPFNFKITKRTTPTITIYNPSTGGTASCRLDSGSYSAAVSSHNDSACMIFSDDSLSSHYGIFFHLAMNAEL